VIASVQSRIPLRIRRVLKGACCALLPALLFDCPGTPDVTIFLDWQRVAGDQGLRAAYGALIDQYPPLTHVALALASYMSRAFDLSPFHGLKLILLVAGYASTIVTQMWRPRLVLPVTAVWSIYGMVYGYLDVLFAAPLLTALWYLEQERAGVAGAAFALACLIKWQPVIIAPFIFAWFWTRRDWSRLIAFTLAAVVVVASVLAVFGLPVIVSFAKAVKDPFISGNALNIPWLVMAALEHLGLWGFGLAGNGAVANETVSLVNSPFPVLLAVLALKAAFAVAYGWALMRFVGSKAGSFGDLILYGLAGFLAFFLLNTGVHENHLFVPALLAVVLLDHHERPRLVMEGVLALSVANLVLFFGPSGKTLFLAGPAALALDMAAVALLVVLYGGLLVSIRKPERAGEAPDKAVPPSRRGPSAIGKPTSPEQDRSR